MSKKVLLLRLAPPVAGLASAEIYCPLVIIVPMSPQELWQGVWHSRDVLAGQEAEDGPRGSPVPSDAVAAALGTAVQG